MALSSVKIPPEFKTLITYLDKHLGLTGPYSRVVLGVKPFKQYQAKPYTTTLAETTVKASGEVAKWSGLDYGPALKTLSTLKEPIHVAIGYMGPRAKTLVSEMHWLSSDNRTVRYGDAYDFNSYLRAGLVSTLYEFGLVERRLFMI